MKFKHIATVAWLATATFVGGVAVTDTDAYHRVKQSVSVLLANRPSDLDAINGNTHEGILSGLHQAASRPRPSTQWKIDEDAFRNVRDFLNQHSEKVGHNPFNSEKESVFEVGGVQYAIAIGLAHGKDVISIAWSSIRKNEAGKIIQGKWIFTLRGDGKIEFVDTGKRPKTIDKNELVRLLKLFEN